MNADGTKDGFEIGLDAVSREQRRCARHRVRRSGSLDDFAEVFTVGWPTQHWRQACFTYGEIQIPELKTFLKMREVEVRL